MHHDTRRRLSAMLVAITPALAAWTFLADPASADAESRGAKLAVFHLPPGAALVGRAGPDGWAVEVVPLEMQAFAPYEDAGECHNDVPGSADYDSENDTYRNFRPSRYPVSPKSPSPFTENRASEGTCGAEGSYKLFFEPIALVRFQTVGEQGGRLRLEGWNETRFGTYDVACAPSADFAAVKAAGRETRVLDDVRCEVVQEGIDPSSYLWWTGRVENANLWPWTYTYAYVH
ncbi:MAG TPA: hypothetical protein VHH36_08220 [Candidatus Thermoplasmatota archaeon]|nr:hypothetical protein [Candidatus Thermoplasmatota archaeon]